MLQVNVWGPLHMINFFSYLSDLQLKHSKTENENIIFETSKFSAFENQWIVRACCETDPSKNISLTYQIIVKTKLIKYALKSFFFLLVYQF